MSKESDAPSDYVCSKCSTRGEFNEDCARCLMRKDMEENEDAYVKMGEVQLEPDNND